MRALKRAVVAGFDRPPTSVGLIVEQRPGEASQAVADLDYRPQGFPIHVVLLPRDFRVLVTFEMAANDHSSHTKTMTALAASHSLVDIIDQPVCCGVKGDFAVIAQRAQASARHFDRLIFHVDENE